jgi:hypothetical protein
MNVGDYWFSDRWPRAFVGPRRCGTHLRPRRAQLKSYGFELGDEAGPRRRPMRSELPRSRHFARPFAITGQRRCAPVSRGTREGTRGFHGCRGQPRRRGFLTSPDHSGRCYERRTS